MGTEAMEFVVQPQCIGDFIVLRNGIGEKAKVKYLDPFASFSYFSMSHYAGFDDHPHKGFDSFTYVLEGAMAYGDSKGRQATISSGDIQWAKMGKGTIHSEKAAGEEVTRAVQVWINVPSENKKGNPECIEISSNDIKVTKAEGYTVKTTEKSLETMTFSDYNLDPMANISWNLSEECNGFAYVLEGEGIFGQNQEASKPHTLIVMPNPHGSFQVRNNSSISNLRFLLFTGKAVKEEVVQHGPFVMNTRDEIDQTIQDYECRRNGFE